MAPSQRRVGDLTLDEFVALMRSTVRDLLQEERRGAPITTNPQAGLLDIPPVSVGEWKPELRLISREEYYDDER